jgi:hypothetical protein
MPTADASGEIFSLSRDDRYEGVVTGRAGAGGSLSVTLEAEACHGLSLEAGAQALVEVNGLLSLILGVRASGFAQAAAGVTARAQLRPDAFERFGVIADLAAHAEASAGGRLAITGDVAPIARWAQDNLDGLALTLFLVFLEELSIEAGVWAQVAVAAMARAHAEVVFSLREQEAGVTIEAGAGAGLGGGVGFDSYCSARFLDVRRFYGRAVRAITREAAAQVRAALPPEWSFGADILEIATPTALLTVFELGQQTTLGTLGPPEQMVQPLLSSFAVTLRTYLLDVALRALPDMLGEAAEALTEAIEAGEAASSSDVIEARLDTLDAYLHANAGREVELADLPVLGGLLFDLADAVVPQLVSNWRHALALLWTGLAVVNALDHPTAQGSWSAAVVGLGRDGDDSTELEFPDLPAFVRGEYRERLGSDAFGLSQAIAFLAAGIMAAATQDVPEAALVLDELAEPFGLSSGELFAAALELGLGPDLTATAAYQRVRDILQRWLDDVLADNVLPLLRDATPARGANYVRDVAAPSLDALSSFLLQRLDMVVGGIAGGPSEAHEFTQKLSAGCSTLAYRIVMRNALFLDHVVLGLVLDGLQAAFTALETDLRSRGGEHVIADTLRTLLPVLYPANPTLAAADVDALTELATTMASIGRDATGPGVWSARRRDRLHALKVSVALGIEGDGAFADRDAVESLLRGLVLCEHVPNEAALRQLTQLMGDIVLDTAMAVVPRGVYAWSLFLLRTTRSIVEEMDRLARAGLAALAQAIDAAIQALERLSAALAEAAAAVAAAAAALQAALHEVASILRSNSRRRDVRNALRAQGADAAAATARSLGGDANAVAFAVGVFDLAFTGIRPLLDLAFDAAETVADDLAGLIGGARTASQALASIVSAVIDAVLGGLTNGMAQLGLTLPPELSADDIAQAIADALPTQLLLGWLDSAIDAGARQEEALGARAQANSARAAAADDLARQRSEQAAQQPGGPLSIVIGSPAALPADLRLAHVQGPVVPVLVRVGGAPEAFFRSGPQRRVRLAINGTAIAYRPGDWVATPAGREYRTPLTLAPGTGLRAGLNVLEVSVVDGVRTMLRTTSAFVVDPNAPSLIGAISVDALLSVFDVRGNDHQKAEQEQVAFRWSGTAPLSVQGWRVHDRESRHVYRFAEAGFAPGGLIVLHTGGDPADNGGEAVFWGRRGAVWNNRSGDTVLLVDQHGFVRATQDVAPRSRSR